jgi:hypothetical protein
VLVKTRKGSKLARSTHSLKSARGGTCQDMESERASSTHKLATREKQVRSRKGSEQVSEGHSLSGGRKERDMSGYRKEAREYEALTSWRGPRDGQIKTRKRNQASEGTHRLQSAESGEKGMSGYRKEMSEGHSQTGSRRERARSGYRKEASGRLRATHSLESVGGGTSQDMETIRTRVGNSPPEERRRKYKSGHGNDPSEQATLTLCGAQGQYRRRNETSE